MAVFEIQGPDGKTYEVDAPDINSAVQAMQSFAMPQGGVSTNTEAVDDFSGKMRSASTGALNGMSFGLGDNIAAGIGGLDSMARGQGFSRGYDSSMDIVRGGMAADQQANPVAYAGGNIAGGAVPAIMASPMATGGTMLGTMARGMGLGAVEGGLQGAGNANGQDVAEETIRGAGMGAFAGAAAPAVVGAAGAVRNAVRDPVTGVIDALIGRANTGKANRAIGGALRSSGKSQDDVVRALTQAQQQGQPEYRLMDALGVAGQRQASGITRAGGDAATEISDYLERRQLGQGERVGGFVEDAFGFRGRGSTSTALVDPSNPVPETSSQILSGPQRSAASTQSNLQASRSATANKAYDAARSNAEPVDVRNALSVIDDRIGGMQGSGVSGDGIDAKLAKYRGRLAAQPGPDGVNRELSDFDRVLGVKRDIQDDIGAAVRAGRNNEARELTKLVETLDSALESSSEMYRTANDGYRESSQVIDALTTGADMSKRGRAADNVPMFSAMTPDQQGAARIGYGDDLLRRLEAVTAPTSNRAKPLQSMKRDAEAGTMALDPQVYRDRLARENEMWQTQNRALGGSRTADNLADQEAMSGMAGGALDVARSAGNFQFGDTVAKIGGLLGPVARGQNDATRKLIADALMSSDPVAALAPVLRQEAVSASTRRIIEALARQPIREGGEALTQ